MHTHVLGNVRALHQPPYEKELNVNQERVLWKHCKLDALEACYSKNKNLCVWALNVTNGQPWLDEKVMLKVLWSDSMSSTSKPNKKR